MSGKALETITREEYFKLTKPKNKYFANKTEVDGIWFDSKKEAERYRQLKVLERCGQIRNLTLQPRFPLIVNESRICEYRADFSYYSMRTCEPVVEDTKGKPTREYKLKKALFEALYGRRILET